MASNIIHVDFRKPGSELIRKGDAAAAAGEVEKALDMYEGAVMQEPDSWEAGFALARYLWELKCWRTSLRECWRLLAVHPEMEKTYGLVYRNLLAMGQVDNARFAYERYMMHLYHDPEDGLNLGEDDPPIPEKPPRKRFKHIIHRAGRYILKNKLEDASHLLAHACHPTFPEKYALRDMLQVELLVAKGMFAEAKQLIDTLMETKALSAYELVGLLNPVKKIIDGLEMDSESGNAYFRTVMEYACNTAYTPLDIYQVSSVMIYMGNVSKWIDFLEFLLDDEPYRVDLVYQLAVCCYLDGDSDAALDYLALCNILDPYDTDISFFTTMLENRLEQEKENSEPEDIPISLQYSPFSMNRAAANTQLEMLMAGQDPEEIAEKIMPMGISNLILDGMCQMDDDLARKVLLAVSVMDYEEQKVFLRRMLVSGLWGEELLEEMLIMLSDLGVDEEVPVMQGHVLKMMAYTED